jgi:hypothetical protein
LDDQLGKSVESASVGLVEWLLVLNVQLHVPVRVPEPDQLQLTFRKGTKIEPVPDGLNINHMENESLADTALSLQESTPCPGESPVLAPVA